MVSPREKLEKIAKRKGIKGPHTMSTETLIKLLYSLPYLYRKDINIIAENIGINKPHNKTIDYLITVIDRYEAVNKLIELGLHKINKRYISKNDLDKVT